MPTQQLINPQLFLDPASVTVATLFAGSNFVIPDYQRDYSWTEEEVRYLWADIVTNATKSFDQSGILVSNPTPHFLGAIVLQTLPSAPNQTHEVIDGQQRLVTLSALFSVLCEFAAQLTQSTDKDNWTQSLKQLLFTFASGNKIPRISLTRDDNHYQELICNRFTRAERTSYIATVGAIPKNSVISRLKACTDLFALSVLNHIGTLGTAGRDAKLIQLFKTALELTVVLQMKVLEQGVAYEVFESLNARGLELQQADLLKNKLYALAERQGTKSDVVSSWRRIVKAIEQQSLVSLTEFLHFHLISKFQDAKQADLYKHVLTYLTTGQHTAKQYTEDAATIAEAIQQILEAGASFAPAVARDVGSLRDLITNKYALTLLIGGATKYNPTSPDMAEVIKLTHHYVFRRFVVEDLSDGAYTSEISRVARDFVAGTIANVNGLRSRLASHSNQASFEARFKDFIAPTQKVGFYVLEMIENHSNVSAGTFVQRQSISQHLEHIMPRRPSVADWAHLSNSVDYDAYLNRIGNFLVLEANINSHIKNNAFSFKDTNPAGLDYQHSQMSLPKGAKSFLENGEWTFKSIKDRQDHLVTNYANVVWAL